MPNTDNDRLAITLGFKILESSFGLARACAVAKDEFLNGVDIAHGGFLFSLADYAAALAANADGRIAISSGASINFLSPCPANEEIVATAKISYADSKTALCDVTIASQKTDAIFAVFQTRMIFKKSQ